MIPVPRADLFVDLYRPWLTPVGDTITVAPLRDERLVRPVVPVESNTALKTPVRLNGGAKVNLRV